MADPGIESDINNVLRNMAETRLNTGTAGLAGSYSLGRDALNLLHRLSSNPETAGDALKLLHELQVHQVEIDLQNEAIQDDRELLVQELAHYKALYESAPVGYFLVDFEGRILRVNRAGAELFDAAPDELHGDRIDRFLAADNHSVLPAMLDRLRQGDAGQAGEVFTAGAGDQARPLRVMANLFPGKRCALLVCCEVA